MIGRLAGVAALVAVWLLTLGSADPVDALLGAGLAVAVVLVGRAPGGATPGAGADEPSLATRVAATPGLVVAVLADVAQGTWDVALRVLGLRPLARPGIVLVPIGERSPRGIAATGVLTALSPGSLLLEVDEQRGVLLFHVIDASDPDAVRARLARFYERHQRRVLP